MRWQFLQMSFCLGRRFLRVIFRDMLNTLHIATYNIHKGFSHFKRRMVVHQLRDSLRALNADIIFLQEVVGHHKGHAARFENWPGAQHEFLADSVWADFAYGKNAVYDEGHHGNAILSRYPITRWDNVDVSAHRFESRGMLHCEIAIPGVDGQTALHLCSPGAVQARPGAAIAGTGTAYRATGAATGAAGHCRRF